ncbi:MAG: hypothetical protein K2Z80_37465 [Xanthobacteraceae bacterium]|nr:hypothetical protein [Xanthobacteraceae bacterium]
MKRIAAIVACGLSLAACSSMPSLDWPSLPSLPKPAPAATTMQFESEPAGAEAKTSLGQSCRTPCSLAVSSNEFTVSFSLQGYQAQTVPVRVVSSTDVNIEGETAPPRLVPNPVFVELQPGGAPARRPPAVAQNKPKPKPAPKPAASRPAPTAMAPAAPAPEAAPASPWPPAPSR